MEQREQQSDLQGWWAVREIDHLFSRFTRYTRFVVYSKWSLLAVAGVLVACLIAWPLISNDDSGLRVSFVDRNSVKAPPGSPVMDKPDYSGTSANGQQYKILGSRATQRTATAIEIEDVQAQMLKANGAWYGLTAKKAYYDQEKKRVDLFGQVTVNDINASSFTTERATIETDTMRVFGHDPIQGYGSMGTLSASGFDIRDEGNHIIFVGGETQLKVIIERKKQ